MLSSCASVSYEYTIMNPERAKFSETLNVVDGFLMFFRP